MSNSFKLIAAACLMLGLAQPVASAEPPTKHVVKVDTSDLNLSKERDQYHLTERLSSAMVKICGYRPKPDVRETGVYNACKASLALDPEAAKSAPARKAFAKAKAWMD